jgi:hypothetical protein
MKDGDPLVIASATPPMMMNDAVAAIFGRTAPSTLPNRKPDTIRRGDHYRSGAVARRRGLTGAASAARSVAQSPSDGSEPRAYSLVRRERNVSLRRAAAKPLPAMDQTWWPEAEIASNFSKDFRWAL